jgi:hypothetical protein
MVLAVERMISAPVDRPTSFDTLDAMPTLVVGMAEELAEKHAHDER